MRTTATIAILGCSLLALAGCKQETNYPAAEPTATVVLPTATETAVVGVPVPGPTSTAVVGIPVPGPTVTETVAPITSPSPK